SGRRGGGGPSARLVAGKGGWGREEGSCGRAPAGRRMRYGGAVVAGSNAQGGGDRTGGPVQQRSIRRARPAGVGPLTGRTADRTLFVRPPPAVAGGGCKRGAAPALC